MNNIDKYITGYYWKEHNDLHEIDSDFKYNNIKRLLNNNNSIRFKEIRDIGCGSGRIIYNFSKLYPNINCYGYDLNIDLIKTNNIKYKSNNLFYDTKFDFNDNQSLILILDVFEHVENYIEFLNNYNKFNYIVFNIPCDLSIFSLLFNKTIKRYSSESHLHFFYDDLIFFILEKNGYEIIDYLYTNNPKHWFLTYKTPSKFIYYCFSEFISFIFTKKIANRIFGFYSITVLCKSKNYIKS